MVVVDKLTKKTHFILVKTTYKAINIAKIYMKEVAKLHGVPKVIVLDRDINFTSNFWKGLFKGFGTNLNLSTMYHLMSYGKIERTNKIIEDMLIMYVMDQPSKWGDYSHLVGISYNNGYQASLKMSPFEALYGKKSSMSVSWDNPTDRVIIVPDLLKEMEERMENIKQNLKDAQDMQKIYANKDGVFRYFKVGEQFFLKVKEKKSSLRLGSCPKSVARYCGHFEIIEKIRLVAHML
jgi:hypothetical protein